ncbi:GNAT family N-acetyltransferase [Methylosinus sp. Sm6]|uniref:GNAT family N-acetyltransferase n=1 Tax=Methylosinus sp. Sm6 TaxID=2866948 RepID=UPI001C9A2428|nr:GNAT family N-acetyltransferase [Methylosinus sp. Sm6]MBY6241277.1 GNAT family N-acetyltransferase [Methylosinus sp. Sm6]
MTEKTPETALVRVVFHDLERESPAVASALGAEIAARFAPRDETPFSILAHDEENGALLGGLNGVIHWRWLYIRHLWVAPQCRSLGLGARLLARAEAAARTRGCVGVYLDSFDPRAVAFYEKRGFSRRGEIAGFPPGHSRVFLAKSFLAEPFLAEPLAPA